MPRQRTFVTPEGLKRIERQLQQLCTIQRPQVIKQLKETLEQASALESPEYTAAKNEQAFVEGRIQQLEVILKTAELIQEPSTDGAVSLGVHVTVTEGLDGPPERYCLVGSVEADPLHGYISNESPLGQALMARRVGDRVTITAPDGEIEFYITAIE